MRDSAYTAEEVPLRRSGKPLWYPVPRCLLRHRELGAFSAVASCASWQTGLGYRYRADLNWIASQALIDRRTARRYLVSLQDQGLVRECAAGGWVITEQAATMLRPGGTGYVQITPGQIAKLARSRRGLAWRDASTLATLRTLLWSENEVTATTWDIRRAQMRWSLNTMHHVASACDRTMRDSLRRITESGMVSRMRAACWQAYRWCLAVSRSARRRVQPSVKSDGDDRDDAQSAAWAMRIIAQLE